MILVFGLTHAIITLVVSRHPVPTFGTAIATGGGVAKAAADAKPGICAT